ncbi:MAG: N-formylglutamate amidohydrolase [Arthrobacter sp.]|jgi:hypothetical protein|nr:N-formylglutamate amidohydrolase [Arthrobacter sp.]
MRPLTAWAEGESTPALIPAGTCFTPEDLIFYADQERRSLEQALAEADLIVTCPHSGSAAPHEVARHLVPEYTRRLQFDYTDLSTAPIVRRWAQIDPRVIYVENPHPRLVRDPNRAKPEDVKATLREAFERVHAAGPLQRVDLSGVDAIRPVTFSFHPLFNEPESEAEWDALLADFEAAGALGVDVYEDTRRSLLRRWFGVHQGLGTRTPLTTLSFHDTMNTTTRPDGAVVVERAEADRLPAVVSLSNRGTAAGEPRGDAAPFDGVTMDPRRLRALASAFRDSFSEGFGAAPQDVSLNQPYLGSQEIIEARDTVGIGRRTREAGPLIDAVQAEFLREFLMGQAAVERLHSPGTTWPSTDEERVDAIARCCRAAWDAYRATLAG